MNDKAVSMIENGLAVAGVTVSLTQIQELLGVVLLAIQIGIILVRLGIKLAHNIKHGKIDEAIQATKDAEEEIEGKTKK